MSDPARRGSEFAYGVLVVALEEGLVHTLQRANVSGQTRTPAAQEPDASTRCDAEQADFYWLKKRNIEGAQAIVKLTVAAPSP